MNTTQKGAYGENRACALLREKGYVLLGSNVREGKKEIDLVMQDKETIVFVEVKARKSNAFGGAHEAIGTKKRAFLRQAAQAYLQRNGQLDCRARFDVVEVGLEDGALTHIENAFW